MFTVPHERLQALLSHARAVRREKLASYTPTSPATSGLISEFSRVSMPEAQFPGISLSGSSVSENPTLLGSSVNLALRVEDELTTLHPCCVGGLLSDADHEVQPSILSVNGQSRPSSSCMTTSSQTYSPGSRSGVTRPSTRAV